MDHNNSEATLQPGALPSTQNEPSTFHPEHQYQPGYHSPDQKFRSASSHDFFGSGPKRLAFSPPYELKDWNELNQSPDAMFPVLVQDKITKLSARFRKRASSPLQHDAFESTVEESMEEYEMDKHTLPKLKIFADEEEFNVKNTNLSRFRGRREFFNGNLNRCKSLDTNNLLLDRVQEAKIEEDLNPGLERNRKMTWSILHDKNEFNKEPKRRGSVGFSSENRYKKFSLQSANSKDTIVEEQERRILPNLHSPFSFLGQINLSSANTSSHGSLHGSYHNSPKFKLKVDEIDIMEKDKKFEEENEYEDIEMILEEAEEKPLGYQDNREFQAAMHKLQEEKEFMKKVIKGDVIGEDEAALNNFNAEKDYMYMKSDPIQEENEDELKPETGLISHLMESNQNQILGIFIEQLHHLSLIAGTTACAAGIDELRSNAFEISDLVGLNANYYFDVPTKYIGSFLMKYQRDLKNSHDIALALLSETIDNVKMYFEGLLSMVRNLPRENSSPMEKPKNSVPVGVNQGSQGNQGNQGNMNNNPYQPNPAGQSQTKGFFQSLFGSKSEKSPVQQQQQQQQPQPQPFFVQQQQQPQPFIPVQITGTCTVDKNGLTYYAQDAYACETCGITAGSMICTDCARVCHAGHKIVKRGQLKGYCDCRFLTTKCRLQAACTFKYTGTKHIGQQKFSCRTCRMNPQQGQMMCQHCADHCHKGHDIIYNGPTESGYCDCKSLYSFCTLNKRF